MKKILVFSIIYILTIGSLLYFYHKQDEDYNKINKEVNSKLNNVTYEEKINDLEKKYNELISNINSITEEEINKQEDVDLLVSNLENKYQESQKENEKLNSTKISLTEQKDVLNTQYNELVEEERKRTIFLINGVSKINQYSIGYPTGCESVALTILLNYWNTNVKLADVVNILPKGSKPYFENSIKYGGNPYLEFIGDPKDKYSYGVYDIPIQNVGNNFKNGIINGRGMSLDEVLEVVRQNRPVIVWSSMNMGIPHYTNSWIYKPTGEKINWLADLHAIVVIGYTKDQIITTDSLTGTIRYFNRQTFESRYNAFGKRALYY